MLKHARWPRPRPAHFWRLEDLEATAARVREPVERFGTATTSASIGANRPARTSRTYQICPSPGQSGMADSVTARNEANWARVARLRVSPTTTAGARRPEPRRRTARSPLRGRSQRVRRLCSPGCAGRRSVQGRDHRQGIGGDAVRGPAPRNRPGARSSPAPGTPRRDVIRSTRGGRTAAIPNGGLRCVRPVGPQGVVHRSPTNVVGVTTGRTSGRPAPRAANFRLKPRNH